jgi:hypothetical protein
MSRLSPFINEHSDASLDAWEKFARELPNAETMDVAALRDHVQGMLDAISADLDTPETEEQREQQSRGQFAHPMSTARRSAARSPATQRRRRAGCLGND